MFRLDLALQDVNIEKLGHAVAGRVVARRVTVARLNVSAFAKATARQSSLSSTTRAKTGGKGIRTPDFQLAKLALYQLSYAPCEVSILSCGLRIANPREHSVAFAVSAKADAGWRS
jgi:hypothetical protein